MTIRKIQITTKQLMGLLEYSTTLPTGTAEGKQWRRADHPRYNRSTDPWHIGQYGAPYPKGHEHYGQIPIIWKQAIVTDAPRHFPRDVRVPRPVPRGRSTNAPEGFEEGHLCMRDLCLGKLEIRRNDDLGGCSCFQNAPCSSCLSQVPECPECGHREPEPY